MRRLPIIRHIRWLYYRVQIARWYGTWAMLGYNDRNRGSDMQVLDEIWRGNA